MVEANGLQSPTFYDLRLMTLEKHLVEAPEESHEPILLRDPVQNRQRGYYRWPKGRELFFPRSGIVETALNRAIVCPEGLLHQAIRLQYVPVGINPQSIFRPVELRECAQQS